MCDSREDVLKALTAYFGDRIQVVAFIVVVCFAAVLVLSSQSAASFPTYILALLTVYTLPKWNDVFHVRYLWMIVALVTYLALTSLWSRPPELRGVFSVSVRSVLIVTFVIAFAECQLRGQLQRWLVRALSVVGSIAAIAAIVAFVVTDPADGRLHGLGQLDTHVVAALVFGVVSIFVVRLLMDEERLPWRVFSLVSLMFLAAGVFLSDSRNAWVSIATGVAVYLLSRATPDRQRFLASVAAAGIFGAVLLSGLLIDEETRTLMMPRGDSFRVDIWTTTIARVFDGGFWFGLGILTPDEVVIGDLVLLHPHNLYLAVFHQGGFVGLALFVMLLAATLTTLVYHYDNEDAKLALGILGVALPAYLLDGSELIDKIGSTWFLIWLPVAISLGLNWRSKFAPSV